MRRLIEEIFAKISKERCLGRFHWSGFSDFSIYYSIYTICPALPCLRIFKSSYGRSQCHAPSRLNKWIVVKYYEIFHFIKIFSGLEDLLITRLFFS